MIPPVPETPQPMTLDDWLNYVEGSLRGDSSAPVQHLRAEIHKAFRTAQREAAERGFREGFAKGVAAIIGAKEIRDRHIRFTHPDFVKDTSKAWAASALHAELEKE